MSLIDFSDIPIFVPAFTTGRNPVKFGLRMNEGK